MIKKKKKKQFNWFKILLNVWIKLAKWKQFNSIKNWMNFNIVFSFIIARHAHKWPKLWLHKICPGIKKLDRCCFNKAHCPSVMAIQMYLFKWNVLCETSEWLPASPQHVSTESVNCRRTALQVTHTQQPQLNEQLCTLQTSTPSSSICTKHANKHTRRYFSNNGGLLNTLISCKTMAQVKAAAAYTDTFCARLSVAV